MIGKVFLLAFALIVTSIVSAEDDGKAYKLEWTDKDVTNCKKDSRGEKKCDLLKAGDVIEVPDVDTCVTWKGKGDTSYDYKQYCMSFRSTCWGMFNDRKNGREPADWAAAHCSEAYSRIWKEYMEEKGNIPKSSNKPSSTSSNKADTSSSSTSGGGGGGGGAAIPTEAPATEAPVDIADDYGGAGGDDYGGDDYGGDDYGGDEGY